MNTYQEFADAPSNQIPVRGFLHLPNNDNGDALILTHGAGTNCRSPLLLALANAFSDAGLTVLRCDLPFRQDRPKGPPPRGSAERDQHGLRAAIRSMRRHVFGRIFVGGHSYGGRQASMLAALEAGLIDSLLLLSYPLHPPQRPTEELRTQHFSNLQTPALFVQGTFDGFGSIDELTTALKLIPAPVKLLPISSVGHELMTKQNGDQLPDKIVEAFRVFVRD